MNPNNYCTIEAAKRLVEAGIVLETDFYHVRHCSGGYWRQQDIVSRKELLNITHPVSVGDVVEVYPAPTMAEVWRELPDTEELIPLICRYIEESNISGSSVMQIIIDICRSPDRLIDLLIFIKGLDVPNAEEENKRLREALDRIATYDLSGLSDIRDAAAVLQKIAREAVS